ncbi:MAG: ribonuclease III [Bacteriovoracaceae bacterium]
MMQEHSALTLNKLNYSFKRPSLLAEALVHSSYRNEHKQEVSSDNERLEFLGDTLLNSFVAIKLVELHPNMKEGELSKLRSSLVNEEALYQLALHIGLKDVIQVGKGEREQIQQGQRSILSDSYEAVIAAIYYDSNFETAFQWFLKTTLEFAPGFFSEEKLLTFDAKTKLQELTLKELKVLPRYEAQEVKRERETWFTVKLFIKEECFGPVTNRSKKEAEKQLAEMAIQHWNHKP